MRKASSGTVLSVPYSVPLGGSKKQGKLRAGIEPGIKITVIQKQESREDLELRPLSDTWVQQDKASKTNSCFCHNLSRGQLRNYLGSPIFKVMPLPKMSLASG